MKVAAIAVRWFTCLAVPVALIGLGVRLLLTPGYLQLEYRLPGFPRDAYGFSMEERLHWGTFGIRYLLNDSPISYLGDLQFSDGTALFGDRELSHMHDVKVVVQQLLRVWLGAVALLIALGALALLRPVMPHFKAGLRVGGWIALAMAATAGLLGTAGTMGSGDLFWQFFSGFHGLFFSGDSWLFSYSDTLIRLYPIRFWQDSVIYIGAFTAIGGAALALGLQEPRQPQEKSTRPGMREGAARDG